MTAPDIIFATGTGRCGSSLVQELLSRHEDVGFMTNLDDLGVAPDVVSRHNNTLFHRVPQRFTVKGRARLAPSEGWRALEREVAPIFVHPGRTLDADDATPWLRDRVASFFTERAAAQGKPVFLHKFTGWPRIGLITAAIPEARFIHVIRDGRAVANSLVQMPWWRDWADPQVLASLPGEHREVWERGGRRFPLLAGMVWDAMTAAHEAARVRLRDDQWIEVRYEDLLDNPRAELTRVLEWAGLTWTDRFAERMDSQHLGRSRMAAFETDLLPSDRADLERVLGERLRRYGYLPADNHETREAR